MARYDALVIDLDGTLLSRGGGVSARNRAALHEAQDAGIEIIVATGRSWKESQKALEAIEHDGLVIAAGGAVLADARSGRTLRRKVIPRTVVRQVADHLLAERHRVLILKDSHATGYDYITVGESALDPASVWWFEHLGIDVRHMQHLDHDPHPEDSLRAGAVASAERLRPLAEHLKMSMAEVASMQHWSAVTSSHATGSPTHLLEIFGAQVNKWTMLCEHAAATGLSLDRVAAIGDGLNDVEIIENAALGIAMANSIPQVLDVADQVAPDHDADGVSEAISHILAGRW